MLPKGGLGKMMKQAQELQTKMAQAQEEISTIEVEANSGGGLVTVKANGKKEITDIKLSPDVLSEDIDLVEDLVLAAVNQALEKAGDAAQDRMNDVTGGMLNKLNIPGM